ncbi:TPA: FAD-dependent oxidoreductase [Klebsiella quasipneumoniae]|uniref:NAD(P)/FAD-dependent oxidoreductase n=1 Tax=Klebsiella quasipneumoniae TaxID=1463165 RepID=UPI0015BB7CB0|nr:FAD-dependent oxidoreductase [Klebsiella quasipneumoniae]NWM05283.1 FAD-binding oxidoreductase [Klebsiella quasipneumoniae]USY13514.1 FAD-binding oxidoreductase [Klebsiella quasipneumoniae]
MKPCDVIVIGAGIIGAACAWQLAKRGQKVTLIDDGQPGATAAGMGHLVCMDDDPAELALSAWSLARWRAITPRMPATCAWRGCGTLWLAESEEEMAVAGEKQRRLAGYQIHSELQTPQQIAGREPLLRSGLAGGLWVPGDSIVYAPNVARWLMADAGDHLTCLHDSAQAITEPQVLLASGKRLQARAIVVACGLEANTLLVENWLRPRKGQLAITDRYGPRVHHQLVELGYGASAHGGGTSVAFNLQPRPTGQLLIGSSRQFDNRERQLDLPLLGQMLDRARHFVPALATLNIIRCWSGLRAASQDGNPLIGPHPTRRGVWLALGHEGLGVTTAPATAELLAAQILGERCPLAPEAWLPARLYHQEAIA